jgi:carbon storage regulator
MLVLSRKRTEVIEIGDNIRIMVIDIHHDRVRIGVEAPSDVIVHRLEVAEQIRRKAEEHGGN